MERGPWGAREADHCPGEPHMSTSASSMYLIHHGFVISCTHQALYSGRQLCLTQYLLCTANSTFTQQNTIREDQNRNRLRSRDKQLPGTQRNQNMQRI